MTTSFANLTLLDSTYLFEFESFIKSELKISLEKPLFESTQVWYVVFALASNER